MGPCHMAFATDSGEIMWVKMTTGSKQGDVYGSLAFCAAFSRPMRKVRARYRPRGIVVIAIMGDFYLGCHPQHPGPMLSIAAACKEINPAHPSWVKTKTMASWWCTTCSTCRPAPCSH